MALDHRTFIDQYEAPVADRAAERPAIDFCRRGEGAARRLMGRLVRRGRRRLAYVDTHFPWRRSGFRYDEALALRQLRPDTLFFSMWEMSDSFPAPVHALSDFPRLASSAGVTDVYAIFLDCAAGLLGEPIADGHVDEPSCVVPPSLAAVLKRGAIRLHVGMYPGSGLTFSAPRLDQARRVAERATTVFTWIPEILGFEHAVRVPQAVINSHFYAPVARDWSQLPRCGSCAPATARRGRVSMSRSQPSRGSATASSFTSSDRTPHLKAGPSELVRPSTAGSIRRTCARPSTAATCSQARSAANPTASAA